MNGHDDARDALVKRLRRIAGQVRGVERMIDEDRYCIDILCQIAAVRAALEQVGAKLLDDHVRHCISDALASGDVVAATTRTDEILEAVQRFAKTR